MVLSFDDFVKQLISKMTEQEVQRGIAYAAKEMLPAGSITEQDRFSFSVKEDSYVGFIDREPEANWGHSARYVTINQKNGEVSSFETRLPPFGSSKLTWRVVYKAPGIPKPNP